MSLTVWQGRLGGARSWWRPLVPNQAAHSLWEREVFLKIWPADRLRRFRLIVDRWTRLHLPRRETETPTLTPIWVSPVHFIGTQGLLPTNIRPTGRTPGAANYWAPTAYLYSSYSLYRCLVLKCYTQSIHLVTSSNPTQQQLPE